MASEGYHADKVLVGVSAAWQARLSSCCSRMDRDHKGLTYPSCHHCHWWSRLLPQPLRGSCADTLRDPRNPSFALESTVPADLERRVCLNCLLAGHFLCCDTCAFRQFCCKLFRSFGGYRAYHSRHSHSHAAIRFGRSSIYARRKDDTEMSRSNVWCRFVLKARRCAQSLHRLCFYLRPI